MILEPQSRTSGFCSEPIAFSHAYPLGTADAGGGGVGGGAVSKHRD